VDKGAYIYRVQAYVDFVDIKGGFLKSLVFAVLVSTICCFQGYFTHMRTDSYGAKSVSLSTTSAVVISCVMILISDYVVTSLLM
jgi:phospholipid/cholesterol/gamma-HCH transport system permease protein